MGQEKKRIAQGSGTQIQDINRLLKQHKQMGKVMKKMGGKNMNSMMQGLQGIKNMPNALLSPNKNAKPWMGHFIIQ